MHLYNTPIKTTIRQTPCLQCLLKVTDERVYSLDFWIAYFHSERGIKCFDVCFDNNDKSIIYNMKALFIQLYFIQGETSGSRTRGNIVLKIT